MSFYTSLSGLKAAQTDLSVISNNVANVGSTGFKKSRAEFGDLISSSPLQAGSLAGSGTHLKSISQQFTQGNIQSTDRGLDLLINGQGFFVTHQEKAGGQTSFTRNGSFGVNADRYVTDSRGAYLQVLPVDNGGNVTASGLSATQNLQIPQSSGTAKATSKIETTVNLPVDAAIPSSKPQYAGGYTFDRFDPNSYNFASNMTVYDASGAALQATTYYTRETAGTVADPSSKWTARTFVGGTELSSDGKDTKPPVPLSLTFDGTGKITAPAAAVQYNTTTPSGAAAPLTLAIDYGTATKQSAAAFATTAFKQDGAAAGQLDNVSVGNDGLVTATYSNGDTQKLGKLVIASFANPAGLRQLGDASWTGTGNSGEAVIGEANAGGLGSIQSGSLEGANVDITEELVALITAQRNFQANAKAIDTANQMTQIAVNLRGS